VNRPFAGALVPMKFFRKDARVSALMLEVNRRLYVDETTGDRVPAFGEMQRMLGRVLTQVADEHPRQGEVP
jgi:N-formylglutamate amidohydrolase